MKTHLCLLLSALLLTGCAGQHHRSSAVMTENAPPPDIRAWLTPSGNQDDGISDTRRQMLTDAGRTLGFRGAHCSRISPKSQGNQEEKPSGLSSARKAGCLLLSMKRRMLHTSDRTR